MRKVLSVLLACLLVLSLAACGSGSDDTATASATTSKAAVDSAASSSAAQGLPGRFEETKKITVEVFDRAIDGGTKAEDNFYTKFIKEGMLRDYNVDVTFVPVPRWTETEQLNNLLAAGTAPDVCVTYSYPTVVTYANMGGIIDLNKYLDSNKELVPDMWNLLGDDNIYWNQEPDTKAIWAIESKLFHNKRENTFVREDWLKKLNLAEPTTMEEFDSMLKAFKSNASTLLGKDAAKIIPFMLSTDVGWGSGTIFGSCIPNNWTDSDEDYYVTNFDDRMLLRPNIKEGVRKLNEWYNQGLVWKDFPLYLDSDKASYDNQLKAGYVGAFIHNWDYPYRDGDNGVTASIKKLAGPDAAYIAVDCFKNDAGVYKKFLSPPIDRKIFFPSSNKEPVASLLYLNWISKIENRKFLQIGEKGVTHEVMPDNSVKTLAATGEKIMNSPYNIDYTITINGLDIGDSDLNMKSVALGYAGIDQKYIAKAWEITSRDAYVEKHYSCGNIKAEEGMGPALKEKRNNFLTQSVTAKPDQFDAKFDSGMKDYLASGGQAIMDERKAAYEKYYKK